MSAVRYSRLTRVSAIAVLLAACAGSVDAFAFFGLGHAFAGIVTGNLVTAGYGLATGNASLVRPTVTAVAGCIAGEVIWAARHEAARTVADVLARRTRSLFLDARASAECAEAETFSTLLRILPLTSNSRIRSSGSSSCEK